MYANFIKLIFWRLFYNRLLLLGFMLIFFSGSLLANNLTLAWDAPATGLAPTGYRLYYGTTSGNYSSSVDAGNTTTYTISNLEAGNTYFFAVKSYDGAGNQSQYSNEASATVPASLTVDFTANPGFSLLPNQLVTFQPTVMPTTTAISNWNWSFGSGASISSSTAKLPTISYSSAGTYSVTLKVNDSTGNTATITKTVTVSASPPVAAFTSSAADLSAVFTDISTGSVSSWSWNFGEPNSSANTSAVQNPSHTYSMAGTYPVTLTVTGPGGSSTITNSISVSAASDTSSGGSTGSTTGTGGTTGIGTIKNGLVAAYGFDEPAGSIAADASGVGNHGDIQQAVRTSTGRFGGALQFDGVNPGVIIDNGNNSQSLPLSTGMTMEAWVYPSDKMSGAQSIITKVQSQLDNTESYQFFANNSSNKPMSTIWTDNPTSAISKIALSPGKWSHVAATYNGQFQSLYINGVLVSKRAQTGTIPASNGALQIGYNTLWGQLFKGYIDEVRIYNRALSRTQIRSDSKTAVSKSNPPKFVIGDKNIEPNAEYTSSSVVLAFQSTAQQTHMTTNIQVYLDAGSTATSLVTGIYSDNNGHPSQLLTQGTSTALKAGAWNSVAIAPLPLVAGQSYWIAIEGSGGTLNLRSQPGAGVTETSISSVSGGLPDVWSGSGSVNESVSAFGAGY